MDIKNIIKEQTLFKELVPNSLSRLKVEAKIIDFEPGEMIISYGNIGKYFGIVLQGELEVLDNNSRRINIIKQGEFLGEMSLLSGDPSIADVVSSTASRVLLIPHYAMSDILPQNPQMIKLLASTMRSRLMHSEFSQEEKEAIRNARSNLPGPEDLLSGTGASEMNILVINCGSSSLKWNFFDTSSSELITGGIIERIGVPGTRHTITNKLDKGKKIRIKLPGADHSAAFKNVLDFLTGDKGPVKSLGEINAVGHRVVHGGEKYTSPVVIDNNVLEEIKKLSSLAPLHNPVNIAGIQAAKKILPLVPQVAVFDTAFHQTMPPYAYLYGLPYKYYKKNGIRRYGFHGTSHHYVAMQAAAFIKKPLDELKIISCHLGNGSSLCAIDHGRSIDTSMGLTPLEGLVMGSRSGDIDAGIIFYLAREYNLSAEDMDKMLNKNSGLLGLSEVSNDMREISKAASKGDQQALMAIQVYCYRIKKYIGAYVAALDGLEVLIFTGGIGLGAAGVRARVCQGLDRLGIVLDIMKNRSVDALDTVKDISDPTSLIKVLVIPTDEEKMIARETMRALSLNEVSKIISMPVNRQREIPINVTERHVHLSQEDCDALFGKNYSFSEIKKLSRSYKTVYQEKINLIGPKGFIENVSIYGPPRSESQVEIGRTEEFLLGIDAPHRAPGDLTGTPGIMLEGPQGKVTLAKGLISPQPHIMMAPENALAFGLKNRDRVIVSVAGSRSQIIGDVLVLVGSKFELEMHINRDEAKTVDIEQGMKIRIIGIVKR